MKLINLIAISSLIALAVPSGVRTQQRKIPKNAFKFTDAVTGKPIPEVLVMPRYTSVIAIGIAPEGPGKAMYVRYYLDKPFLYRTGTPFTLKTLKFCGLPLLPIVIGKGGDLKGILIVAPGHRPLWTDDLWRTRDFLLTRDPRDLQLTPMGDHEWSVLLKEKLMPLTRESVVPATNFDFWGLTEDDHRLHIDYNKNERELVRRFLQATERRSLSTPAQPIHELQGLN